MDLSNPFRAITATVDADVLFVLASGDVTLSGRQVAARIPHRSYEGVRGALGRLVLQGVVDQASVGRAQSFTLNRDHVLASPLIEIAGARRAVIIRARELIAAWRTPPSFAFLFGSASRGDATARSDLDLLIVRPRLETTDDGGWGGQLVDLQLALQRMTGNDPRILEYSYADFAVVQHGAVEEAVEHGIPLCGTMASARRLRKQLA